VPTTHPAFSQPTCPICLDDFEPNITPVRELPCRHIFHPDCVDAFLLNNSSLCPMCKKSVLPNGYCPTTITNAMVRRERYIRRYRERAQSGSTHNTVAGRVQRFIGRDRGLSHNSAGTIPPLALTQSVVTEPGNGHQGRIRGAIAHTSVGRRVFSAPVRALPDIEMGNAATQPATIPEASATTTNTASAEPSATLSSTSLSCEPPPANSQTRREWARQRALELLRNRNPPEMVALEEAEARRERGWRRVLGKIFPSA
jgi:hypothetical protein